MFKKVFSLLWVLSLLLSGLASAVFAQIIVEDARFTWERALEIPVEVPEIPSRIVGEYVTIIYIQDLVYPEGIINGTSNVPLRIVVEYATAVAHFGLNALPVCEGDFNNDVDVDGSDLAVFAADFGRTDCAGDCGGDFDEDGDVDGSDLAVFAADFGRTDCPYIYKVE